MTDITYSDIKLISVDDIETGSNHRKKFNQKAIDELADSIKKVGLINPITVCDTKFVNESDAGLSYILIAGERRFKACVKLGMMDVPCMVVEGPTEKLLELQLIENCQRVDINPIEELNGFMGLIKGGAVPESIADRVGKSTKYVNERLNLIRLSDDAKVLMYDGKLNMAQAKYLILMDNEQQDRAINSLTYKDGLNNIKLLPSKNFHEYYMKNNTIPLTKARFNTDTCNKCKYNSGANKVLFAEISKQDFCSNHDCFTEKTQEHVKALKVDYEQKSLDYVEVSQVYSEKYDFEHNYTRIPDEIIEKAEVDVLKMLIVVDGDNIGLTYPIYSESQLKAEEKTEKLKSDKPDKNANKAVPETKLKKAVSRYGRLVVGEVAKKYVQKNEIFTESIVLLSMFNSFKSLIFSTAVSYLKTIGCEFEANNSTELSKAFMDNLQHLSKNLEYNFAILNLYQLEGFFAYSSQPENKLLLSLAKDAEVDIEKCKKEIAEEYGVDLTDI